MWLSKAHSFNTTATAKRRFVYAISLTGYHRDLHPALLHHSLRFVKIARMFGNGRIRWRNVGFHMIEALDVLRTLPTLFFDTQSISVNHYASPFQNL
jgi:hypothetical protein